MPTTRSLSPAPDAAVGTQDRELAWQFVILAEIRNFPALRRHVGWHGTARIASVVAERVGALFADARCEITGRASLEIWFSGPRPALLNDRLAMLREACSQPFALGTDALFVDLVFGVAAAPHNFTDAFALVEEAETVLAQARATDAIVAPASTTDGPDDRQRLAQELEKAIADGDLVLQYQPKIHVRRQQICSAEALVRWHHPERGLIPPNDFIPTAERSRLIGKLTLWTLRQAIADYHAMAAAGHDLRLFVNVSGQVLGDLTFVDEVRRIVGATDAKIGFEITETAVIRDPETAIRNLQIFADLGIIIAIDDYGAGLSSLAYLKKLPARELKIDKLFVTQLTSSNRDPLIVRSTIDLAHALDMEVVAEGVETHAALALLMVMGCDMVQGYLISRPIGRDALVKFLAEDRNHAAPQETRASFNRLAAAWKHA